ncbi:hypothetical protein FJTKL_07956 [Diaporthe vaccinii]|uniref:Uncharacterized protein n=1 Tax=Diaporthe vaccinii TaxID=105482 RepID=A0ABR4FE14_9PEZI
MSHCWKSVGDFGADPGIGCCSTSGRRKSSAGRETDGIEGGSRGCDEDRRVDVCGLHLDSRLRGGRRRNVVELFRARIEPLCFPVAISNQERALCGSHRDWWGRECREAVFQRGSVGCRVPLDERVWRGPQGIGISDAVAVCWRCHAVEKKRKRMVLNGCHQTPLLLNHE